MLNVSVKCLLTGYIRKQAGYCQSVEASFAIVFNFRRGIHISALSVVVLSL